MDLKLYVVRSGPEQQGISFSPSSLDKKCPGIAEGCHGIAS
jgi:hypothetical protein